MKVHGKDLAISKRVALVRRQTLALSLFMSLSLSLSDCLHGYVSVSMAWCKYPLTPKSYRLSNLHAYQANLFHTTIEVEQFVFVFLLESLYVQAIIDPRNLL